MNTDERELTDREIYEREGLGDEFDAKYGSPLNPREYMRVLKARARMRESKAIGSGAIFNGSTKMIGWLLGINAVLICAAITGGMQFAIKSSERMSAMEAKMEFVIARLK